ncbi:MAG: acyl carrier protein [Chlorobi bacterium]|nr:acyl carrier protein [Chlorobiota bacterium]
MTREDIKNNTISVFKEVFKETVEFRESTGIEDIKSWDSLNHIILIKRLEEVFTLQFDLFKLIDLKSLGDFVDYIYFEKGNED